MQVWQHQRYQSVQLIKTKFEHGQLSVEKLAHAVLGDDLAHDCEGQGFAAVEQVEETCYEVHALAVVQIRIYYRVGFQDQVKIFRLDLFQIIERAIHINIYSVRHLFRYFQQ